MKINKLKIAVVAPRFHTNLYYRVKALERAGYIVKVFSLYKGISEYHKDVDLIIVNESLLSKIISKLLRLFKKTYLKSNLELKLMSPSIILKREILKFKPDLILIKSFMDILLHKVIRIAKKINAKIIILLRGSWVPISFIVFTTVFINL